MKKITLFLYFLYFFFFLTIEITALPIQKLDPILRPYIKNGLNKVTTRDIKLAPSIVISRKDDIISALVKVSGDPKAIESSGARIRTIAGDIVTADIPIEALGKLISLPEVAYIRLSRQMKPSVLDVSVPDTKADQAWNSIPGYTGKGVIVGVIDQGIDWSHPDFKDKNGNSRILYIWDQTMEVAGYGKLKYGYGTEWSKNDIDSGRCLEIDGSSHGTHVTSTAAGNSNGNHDFTGVAPDASIIFVKTWFGDAEVIDACDYIFRKAQELGMPAVINMSFGSQWGPHDGTDLMDQAIDAMLNINRRAAVSAAGNDGDSTAHIGTNSLRSPINGRYPWAVFKPLVGDRRTLVQVWYSLYSTLSVRLLLPENESGDISDLGMGWASEDNDIIEYKIPRGPLSGAKVNIIYELASPFLYPNFNGIFISIQNNDDPSIPIEDYDYVIEFDGPGVKMDAYMLMGIGFLPNPPLAISLDRSLFLGGNSNSTVTTPASAKRVICVGSYVTKSQWIDSENRLRKDESSFPGDISVFSSRGPLLNGDLKPDIAAPGDRVVAAFSSDSWERPKNIYQDGIHAAFRGTSMASPHVAGAVALLFQQNPNLNAHRIKDLLINSAIDSGPLGWDKAWGFGKMDVLAALGIPSVPSNLNARFDNVDLILEWTPNTEKDLKGYILYRELSNGNWILDLVIGPEVSRIVYPALNIKNQTSFAISAFDKDGNESQKSQKITVSPKNLGKDVIPPSVPQNLIVTAIDKALELKWQPCSDYDLDGYRIYYGKISGRQDRQLDVGNVTKYRIENLNNGEGIYVAISAIDKSGNESQRSNEVYSVPMVYPTQTFRYQKGWPVSVDHDLFASPAIHDFDGDNRKELSISTRNGKVYLLNYDGTIRPGWPVDTNFFSTSSPAIGDIDKNGRFDIVIGSGNKIYAWNENGTEMDGWPVATGGNIVATPALGDIDNDGKLEVIIGSRDGYVYVFKWDGSMAKGWPVKTESYINSSAALGDIDGDRKLEIVVTSGNGAVYVFNADGNIVNGWPVTTLADIYSSPALGDLDGDGKLEIVTADKEGYVHAWHHNGQNVNGWPVRLREDIEASPALGDIDGDKNTLEIVIGTLEGSIYVLKNNGTPMNGWPVPIMDSIYSSPALADIDGDGEIEVIVASSTGYRYVGLIYAFRKTGEKLSFNWPIYIEGNIKYSSPVIADMDGDGDIELAIGSCRLPNLVGGKIHVWDLEGRPDPRKIVWNGFRNDSLRTGAVKDSIPPSLLMSILRDYIKKRRVTLYATASEKINESLMLIVELGEGKDKKILQSIPMVLLNEQLLLFRASFKPEVCGKYTFTVTGADLYGNIGYASKSIFVDSPFKIPQQPSIIPEKFSLLPNFPNPFNPYTWIPYELPKGSDVTIEIYSLDGKLIRSLNIGYRPAGAYTNEDTAAYWDGTDNLHQPVASGIYFCVLKAGNFKATRKMLLAK